MSTPVHHRAGALAALAGAVLISAPAAAQLEDLASAQPAADAPFADTRVEVPRRGVLMALRDLTGDRALELLRVDERGVLARRLTEDGTYETGGSLCPGRRAPSAGTCRPRGKRAHGPRGSPTGKRSAHVLLPGGWSEPVDLFESATYLPSGVARVPFARHRQ